ncbi:NgoMIV family type II restriction endonuclease [Eggerthella timonensis]|uniref:NgoMIV family type II restriction endonuclease n=1 Tax=Eggerthella timonensis TaxID=1871008 RepID=UPI000C78ECE9|nr:NgoMIV family type II restriction endonuclease [Eggerthella timonensis]
MDPLVAVARDRFHASLLKGTLTVSAEGIPSNADKGSKLSIAIAKGIADQLEILEFEKIAGQTSGSNFEEAVKVFLEETFLFMGNLRPGIWSVEKLGNRSRTKTSSFVQYHHLSEINALIRENEALATVLGNDYLVCPDILISREPYDDDFINVPTYLVDDSVSTLADIRAKYRSLPILHASVSAKWTIRSDRAQNSRTEALNLIRNRKGSLPHIAVVTAEPLPSRISSLALGTGDIDCVYHFALYELRNSIEAVGAEDALELLDILVEGNRLKDISDLPLDLCV